MKKRIISLALSAITAISAVSAMSANALYNWGAEDEESLLKQFENCVKIEDFEWIQYKGNTGAGEPIAVYMDYNEEFSFVKLYHMYNMPDTVSFNIDKNIDISEIENLVASIDENLAFSANTALAENDTLRVCMAQSNEITLETAKKVREALGDKAETFSYTNSLSRYSVISSDYLTGYTAKDITFEELTEKLENYVKNKKLDAELVSFTFGDVTPDGAPVNCPQTMVIPKEKLTPAEHLELAKDIYDETGMQPCLYHVESMSNNGKLSNELNLTDYLNGDANCDKSATMADAAAILQAIGNPDKYALSDQGEFNADYACDGLTADDAIAIQKKLAGITE
ncbi:MAG: hypothetical protein J6A57_04960 [Ruminococcus sp.]|nr:hypothetical protein [Ruminococcus sp.]